MEQGDGGGDGQTERTVVERLIGFEFEKWPGDAFELLAEDVIIHTSAGQLFAGHTGWTRWFEQESRSYKNRAFEFDRVEGLGAGWYLLSGSSYSHGHDDELSMQPGFWLVRVFDSRIRAILFFRTEGEARAALPDLA